MKCEICGLNRRPPKEVNRREDFNKHALCGVCYNNARNMKYCITISGTAPDIEKILRIEKELFESTRMLYARNKI